jgi:hypothetical protein
MTWLHEVVEKYDSGVLLYKKYRFVESIVSKCVGSRY